MSNLTGRTCELAPCSTYLKGTVSVLLRESFPGYTLGVSSPSLPSKPRQPKR